MMARELSEQTYPQIGVPDGHHSVSHNGEMPDMVEKYVKINTYHVQLFADFLKKMQATPDGDGTLLDHSMILYGSGMGNSNLHAHEQIRSWSQEGRPADSRAIVTSLRRKGLRYRTFMSDS